MGGERFRINPEQKKLPTGVDSKQPSGFSIGPKESVDSSPPPRRFRLDPQRWPNSGGYPEISGGARRGRRESPSPLLEQLGEIDDPEKARKFFELFFQGEWIKRNPTTGRKLNRGFTSTVREANRLHELYPEIYEEVRRAHRGHSQ